MEKHSAYFFIPGNFPGLSLKEIRGTIETRLPGVKFSLENHRSYFIAVFDTQVAVEQVRLVFDLLGSATKFGVLLPQDTDLASLVTGKQFGVSIYTSDEQADKNQVIELHKATLKQIKKAKSAEGIRVRYINSREVALTSGQIVGTSLLEKGVEIVLFSDSGVLSVGKTLAVQDIEGFSKREFERPAINKRMGMLPVKLCRIMINLAKVPKGSVIWDPFCGSGTLLNEALLMGYDVLGSDISNDAMIESHANLEWLSKNYDLKHRAYNLFNYDVKSKDKRIEKDLKNTEVAAIAFEPYMGAPARQPMSPRQADGRISDLMDLLQPLMRRLEFLKMDGVRVVAVIPAYKTHKGWVEVRANKIFSKKWQIEDVDEAREGLHWERSSSIIRRNIVVATLNRG